MEERRNFTFIRFDILCRCALKYSCTSLHIAAFVRIQHFARKKVEVVDLRRVPNDSPGLFISQQSFPWAYSFPESHSPGLIYPLTVVSPKKIFLKIRQFRIKTNYLFCTITRTLHSICNCFQVVGNLRQCHEVFLFDRGTSPRPLSAWPPALF